MCLNCKMTTGTRIRMALWYFVFAIVCVLEAATFGLFRLCAGLAWVYSRVESK